MVGKDITVNANEQWINLMNQLDKNNREFADWLFNAYPNKNYIESWRCDMINQNKNTVELERGYEFYIPY